MHNPLCPACSGGQMVEISLTLAGRPIVMRSCSRCETRWWGADGRDARLDEVLDIAATTRR